MKEMIRYITKTDEDQLMNFVTNALKDGNGMARELLEYRNIFSFSHATATVVCACGARRKRARGHYTTVLE